MDVPGIVADALADEEVAARVDLGGEDDLFVTPTRTLIYRSEGLLSDESVEEYEHDAERLDVTTGRRKTKLTLTYPIDGSREFRVPANSTDAAVSAILAGILNANGVLESGESVLETFRFSELTLVVTSERLVKHVGEAVWDLEFEEFRYEDVTGIAEEAGSVATQLVLTVDGRAERIKTPNDRAPEVERRLKEALREYHGLGEHEDITAALSPDDEDEPAEAAADERTGGMSFEDGVDPLDAGDTSDTSSIDLGGAAESAGGGEEPAGGEAGTTQGAGETPEADQNASGAASPNHSAGGSATSEQAAGESAPDAQSATATNAGDDAVATADGAATDDRAGGGSADASSEAAATDASTADANATDASTDDEGEEADPFERAGFQSAADSSSDVQAEIEELRAQLEKQNQLLARQQQTIEQLVEELRRSR